MFQRHTADKFTIITQVFTLPEETKQKENIETFVPAKWCQLVQYSSVGEHRGFSIRKVQVGHWKPTGSFSASTSLLSGSHQGVLALGTPLSLGSYWTFCWW